MKVRLTNITITCDVELLDGPLLPTTPVPVIVVPPVVPGAPDPPTFQLPTGYATDKGVGNYMLVDAMTVAGLTPIGVQGHGPQIIAALKARYPDLDVYLSSTDSPIWPGFGSLDVTVDSGKKGWSFRPDGYFPWKPVGQR